MVISFKEQLLAWRRVIFALFLRELQSKFNDRLGLGWAFVEPFAFVFVLSYVRGMITGKDAHGIPVFVFMLIGLICIQSFMTCITSIPNSIKKDKPLYAFRQVQPIASLITALFLEFAIKCGVIVMSALAVYIVGFDFQMESPLLLIALFFLLWLLGGSLGLIFAVLRAFIPEFDKIKGVITRPLFFISCVFFSLQDVPKEYWPWLDWNPMVHIIELARYACYPSYGHEGVELQYIIEVALVCLFIGLALYHITWKKILAR